MKEILYAILAAWVAYNIWRVLTSTANAVEVGATSITNVPLPAAFADYLNVREYYLELSPGHRKYQVTGTTPAEDMIIEIWETAGFQFVKHHYRIAELVENERMRLVSEQSKVLVLGLFPGQNRSEATFGFATVDERRTRLSLTIRIMFPNAFRQFLARMFFTEAIWRRHACQEMNALAAIIEKRHAAALDPARASPG